MAKEKITKRKNGTQLIEKPEFKPGNKPYMQYDGVVLNANVPWDEILSELVAKGFTYQAVALEIGAGVEILKEIEAKSFDNLPFRAGARMLTMHSCVYPQNYSDF